MLGKLQATCKPIHTFQKDSWLLLTISVINAFAKSDLPLAVGVWSLSDKELCLLTIAP